MDNTRSLRKEAPKGLSRPATKTSTMERSEEMKKVDAMTADYVVEIMNARTSFHKLHLEVTGSGSFAAHKALNELYDAIPDLTDTIAEGYQGACEVLLNYPDKAPVRLLSVEGAIEYLRQLKTQTSELQQVVPHTEVVNNLDLIKDEINAAKYKLLFLS